MKIRISFILITIIGMLFLSSIVSAQNNTDIFQKLQLRIHKYLDLENDGQIGFENAAKERRRQRIQNCECHEFIDENSDGVCDNCGGALIQERTRTKVKSNIKRRTIS